MMTHRARLYSVLAVLAAMLVFSRKNTPSDEAPPKPVTVLHLPEIPNDSEKISRVQAPRPVAEQMIPKPLAEPYVREVEPGVFEVKENQVHVAYVAPPPAPLAPGETPMALLPPPSVEVSSRSRPPEPPLHKRRTADDSTVIYSDTFSTR